MNCLLHRFPQIGKWPTRASHATNTSKRLPQAGEFGVCLSFQPLFRGCLDYPPSPMTGHFPHLLTIFRRGPYAHLIPPTFYPSNSPSTESKSETDAPSASGTIQLIGVFNALTIMGFLSLGAVLLTALLSSNVRRIPTWYSLFATWMVFAFSYFLLVGQQIGPDPGFGICLTQAGLVYAAPVLYIMVILRNDSVGFWLFCFFV